MIFALKKAKIIDKASSKRSHEAWIKFTPCGLRTTSLVNDKNHTINNLQPLQRFIVLERLLYTYLHQSTLKEFSAL
jgi:hypothetical protein